VQVEVSGKAYNVNQRAFSKDDIIVETVGSYVDSAGQKTINLTAKLADTAGTTDVVITKVIPSAVTVYFDKEVTDTFNVVANLQNDMSSLATDEFTIGNIVPSMTTIDVKGPATIINKLEKVYFNAKLDEDSLPLKETKEIEAEVAYVLDRLSDSKYLSCPGINESNPPTVTIPLYVSKQVNTSVKFVNQPAVYNDKIPEFTVYPAKVNVLYNSKDEEIENLFVGTVDFRNVSNKVNYFEFPVDEKLGVNLVDKSISKFTVSLDMSSMSSVTLQKTPAKIVFLNQDESYSYTINFEKSELNSVTVMGPKDKLDKITEEDMQIEINVSSLSLMRSNEQLVEVSNISIVSEGFDDCWVYGKYNAYISVEEKE
ncbi:MAG: hypothetical protein J6V06_06000, partial [Clostridia bacterium]|nr:hypothetical protein [Clostridia bacterium]